MEWDIALISSAIGKCSVHLIKIMHYGQKKNGVQIAEYIQIVPNRISGQDNN
jgi:hypothetical protein